MRKEYSAFPAGRGLMGSMQSEACNNQSSPTVGETGDTAQRLRMTTIYKWEQLTEEQIKQHTPAGKRLALEYVNEQRAAAGKPLARSIQKLWWRIYGPEFIAKALEVGGAK